MTNTQWFLDESECKVKERFTDAKAVLFCGIDECMGELMGYYMVVCGFGVCYRVVVTSDAIGVSNSLTIKYDMMD